MNSALLIGQLVLLVALVPSIYLANFYYDAYHTEVDRGRKINSMLVLDKYLFVTELSSLQAHLDGYARRYDSATVAVCAKKIAVVLAGNARRLKVAKNEAGA